MFLDVDPIQFRALLAWLVDVKRVEPGTSAPAPPVMSLPLSHRAGFVALCSYLCDRDGFDAEHQISDSTIPQVSDSSGSSQPAEELKDSLLVSVAQARQLRT